METISSIRFHKTNTGDYAGEITVTAGGDTKYPRLANLAEALAAAKALGAEIRGVSRVITLRNAERIAANGGNTSFTMKEYYTTPVRGEVTLLGDYAEFKPASLAGITREGNTLVDAYCSGVATPMQVSRKPAASTATADDIDG